MEWISVVTECGRMIRQSEGKVPKSPKPDLSL